MIVTEKGRDFVRVAEVNEDDRTCVIAWGRTVTREYLVRLGSTVTYSTRYPD